MGYDATVDNEWEKHRESASMDRFISTMVSNAYDGADMDRMASYSEAARALTAISKGRTEWDVTPTLGKSGEWLRKRLLSPIINVMRMYDMYMTYSKDPAGDFTESGFERAAVLYAIIFKRMTGLTGLSATRQDMFDAGMECMRDGDFDWFADTVLGLTGDVMETSLKRLMGEYRDFPLGFIIEDRSLSRGDGSHADEITRARERVIDIHHDEMRTFDCETCETVSRLLGFRDAGTMVQDDPRKVSKSAWDGRVRLARLLEGLDGRLISTMYLGRLGGDAERCGGMCVYVPKSGGMRRTMESDMSWALKVLESGEDAIMRWMMWTNVQGSIRLAVRLKMKCTMGDGSVIVPKSMYSSDCRNGMFPLKLNRAVPRETEAWVMRGEPADRISYPTTDGGIMTMDLHHVPTGKYSPGIDLAAAIDGFPRTMADFERMTVDSDGRTMTGRSLYQSICIKHMHAMDDMRDTAPGRIPKWTSSATR